MKTKHENILQLCTTKSENSSGDGTAVLLEAHPTCKHNYVTQSESLSDDGTITFLVAHHLQRVCIRL